MRWRNRSPFASKIARIHNNYTRLEYYPETTEEQANVFKKGILQSGQLLWGLAFVWDEDLFRGRRCCLLRPSTSVSLFRASRWWRVARNGEWGTKKRGGRGVGGGGRREEAGRRFFRPLSPPPTPSLCFPAHFSLSRSHYLNAWNRIDRFTR